MMMDLNFYVEIQLANWAFKDEYTYPYLQMTEFKSPEIRA